MMSHAAPTLPDLGALRAKGAPRVDAVGWHYIETLAERIQAQSGPTQQLLLVKLLKALERIESRMANAAGSATAACAVTATTAPSPMAGLLQDMVQRNAPQPSDQQPSQGALWRAESPRIQQFRRQLSKISVQKQVTQAIAQAPQNAGPINSHMLVLRSLGLMRNISPDYLNRFMTHVDTLLRLDEADKGKLPPKKAAPAAKTRK
jgi:hypothetical protein